MKNKYINSQTNKKSKRLYLFDFWHYMSISLPPFMNLLNSCAVNKFKI